MNTSSTAPSGGDTNQFLRGNWYPQVTEVTTAERCTVTAGELPGDLAGSFLRVGPNPSKGQLDGMTAKGLLRYHFFAGDGMVHGVELGGGEARYRRRFVSTPHFLTGVDRVGGAGAALDPSKLNITAAGQGDGAGERGGLANTALVFHAGRLLALEEGSKPYEVALPGLQTVGRFTFGSGPTSLQHNFTAHPKVCGATGEMVFFGYGAHSVRGSDAFLHASVADAFGSLVRTVPVHFRRPVMAHDMAVTRNYTLLMDFPLWDMGGATKAEDRSRFGVMRRHASSEDEVVWFDGCGLFGYHTANCFEREKEGGGTLIELLMVAALGFSFSRSNARALHLRRWVFDLETGETLE